MAAGLALMYVMQSRLQADTVGCRNHLRELGLVGVRHASLPGIPFDGRESEGLPPGTCPNPTLAPDRRLSWYAYMLNVLDAGPPDTAKQRRPTGLADLINAFDAKAAWDAKGNAALAQFKLASAICPAQVPAFGPGLFVPTNYLAVGGLGLDAPTLSMEAAGVRAGAYRYDGGTPDKAIVDGLRQTAQIIETNWKRGPWLQGGASSLRGLDVADLPYLGVGRPFGGCHRNGCYASMADGSVQFLRDSIDPAIFRSLFTIAGGPGEQNFDAP